MQAAEQVAPGLHWHVEPHLQFAPQSHDVAPFWVVMPAAASAEATLLYVLHLLAHLFDHHFHLDSDAGGFQILRFR